MCGRSSWARRTRNWHGGWMSSSGRGQCLRMRRWGRWMWARISKGQWMQLISRIRGWSASKCLYNLQYSNSTRSHFSRSSTHRSTTSTQAHIHTRTRTSLLPKVTPLGNNFTNSKHMNGCLYTSHACCSKIIITSRISISVNSLIISRTFTRRDNCHRQVK